MRPISVFVASWGPEFPIAGNIGKILTGVESELSGFTLRLQCVLIGIGIPLEGHEARSVNTPSLLAVRVGRCIWPALRGLAACR